MTAPVRSAGHRVTVPDRDTTGTEIVQYLGTELGKTIVQRFVMSGLSIRWMLVETLFLRRLTIQIQLNNVRPYGHYKEI